MKDILATIIAILAIILAIAVFLSPLAFIGYTLDTASCRSKASKMGFEYSYGIMQGCMIKVKGQYVPIENYKVIN